MQWTRATWQSRLLIFFSEQRRLLWLQSGTGRPETFPIRSELNKEGLPFEWVSPISCRESAIVTVLPARHSNMEDRLVADGDSSDANRLLCEPWNANETKPIECEHFNATVSSLMKAAGRYVMSDMFTTWIVVGSLIFVGIFLAFALDRKRRKNHAYLSVSAANSVSIQMDVIESRCTSRELQLAKEIKGKLLILYETDCHFLLVKQLIELLRHTLPKWQIILDEEHLNDICVQGKVKWVLDAVYYADRIIVIGSPENKVLHGDLDSIFSIARNCILNDRILRGNHSKIFNVRFECSNRSNFAATSSVLGLHFVLPTDYVRMINHVLGNSLLADAFCRDLKQKLTDCRPYQSLETAVRKICRTDDGLPHRGPCDLSPPPGRSHDLAWILHGWMDRRRLLTRIPM